VAHNDVNQWIWRVFSEISSNIGGFEPFGNVKHWGFHGYNYGNIMGISWNIMEWDISPTILISSGNLT